MVGCKKIHTYFVLFKHEILLKGNRIKRAKNMLMIMGKFWYYIILTSNIR